METTGQTNLSVQPLFQPFRWGSRKLRNRIVMAPMTRSHSPGKVPGPDVAKYYRRRAEGGTALIITEGTNPDHPAASGYPDVPGFYGNEGLAGWKTVVDEVHAAGGAIIPQLWHCGSVRKLGMEPDPAVAGFAPSAVPNPMYKEEEAEVPREMTQADIDETIASIVRSAVSAQQLGFDGIELHGAHGYLIDQFFWKKTNKRNDRYGGSFENRLTFAVELIEAVRSAVTPDFPVVFRFSQWKLSDYDCKLAKTPHELESFLMPLAKAGINVFHASTRRFNEREFEDSNLILAGLTKKISGLPTITVGSVGLDIDFLHSYQGKDSHKVGLDTLVARLERDEFDLVAVGRALLADPAWPNKIKNGCEEDVVSFKPEHLSTFE